MKILQLQQNIISQLIKNNNFYYDEDNKNIYYSDSYSTYIVPKDQNFINLNKLEKVNILHFFKDYHKSKLLKVESMKLNRKDKFTSTLLEATCEGEKVYFYKDNFKYFSKNCEFYKLSPKSYDPIYVLEDGDLKGCFLTVNPY